MRTVTVAALASMAPLILPGCAAVRSLVEPAPPPPVRGVLTSAVDRLAYDVVDLADPTRRRLVKACEEARRRDCRTRPVPRDRRTSFTKGADPRVIALLSLSEPVPGTARGIACRFLGPGGRLAAQVRITAAIPADAPRGAALDFPCAIDLARAAPAGRWALEVYLDGRRATVLPFEVREAAAGSRPAAPAAAPRPATPRPPAPAAASPRPAAPAASPRPAPSRPAVRP